MVDVCIVGGGVIGVAIAYYLSLEKIRVLVLERHQVGQQASQGAVGFLSIDSVPFVHDALRQAAIESRRQYHHLERRFKETCGVDIELEECGTLRVAMDEADLAALQKEIEWHREHVAAVEFLSPEQVAMRFPVVAAKIAGGFFYPEDIQVTSSRVVAAFRAAAEQMGAVFVEQAQVNQWEKNGHRVTAVLAGERRFTAERFILAAGPWSEALGRLIGLYVPVYPVRGQLLIFAMKERFLPCPIIAGGANELYYLGPKQEGCIYAGTTLEEAGFDTQCTEEALERIGREVARLVPRVSDLPIKGSWAGLRPATRDKLPIIGQVPGWENLWLATGHFRKGVLLAPFTGQAVANLILGRRPAVAVEEFHPARFQEV